ncbi:MAG: hypothetical protein HOO88_05295 [Kiritimatiellaceae bacterium]|nr:hypothetical protein [Kiritimatiellaceae bacterium]
MLQYIVLIIALLTLTATLRAAPDTRPPLGGGILDAGLNAEYFANPDLSGKPAFTRKDIRVRFDWGEVLPVAGSTSPGMKNFPVDQFSVRWTGRIMPRFSETYTLSAEWDEGLRWSIRPTGETKWTVLIDSWDKSGKASATYKMKENTSYDTLVEYRDITGAAKLELRWSSPSTPDELLDCASMNALGGTSYEKTINADVFRCFSPWGAKANKEIAAGKYPLENWGPDGWYNGDWTMPYFKISAGRHLFLFNGKATVTSGKARFIVNGEKLDKVLPSGTGYDPASNLTTALVELINPADDRPDRWDFTHTQRDDKAAVGTGVRNIRLMKPITPGSGEPHLPGEVVNRTQKDWISNYTNLRFYCGLGENRWEDRTRPGEYDHFAADALRAEQLKESGGGTGYGNLEDYILYANELGRDLYLCVNGHNPDPDYLNKLAQAIRYGTDGKNPYTNPTANPVYPPLNPNLRIVIEFSNEIWNYWPGQAAALCKAAVERGDADGKILNYDGQCPPTGDFHRWQALKTVQVSDAFRTVFGDDAMGDRVRILVFGQYNATRVLTPVLQFIDNYWNNVFVPKGKTANVATPHPVNYFIWGGGGATYYANSNPTGKMNNSPLRDGSFENIAVGSGQVVTAPSGSAWTFAGAAGVGSIDYAKQPTIQHKSTTPETVSAKMWRGFKFAVGDKDIYVTELGRLMLQSEQDQTSRIVITDENGKPAHAIGGVKIPGWQGKKLPPSGEYRYFNLTHRLSTGKTMSTVIKLDAGKTYYLFTEEIPGIKTMGVHAVQTDSAIKILGAAQADGAAKRENLANIKLVQEGSVALGGGDLHYKAGGLAIANLSGMPPLAEKRTGIDGKNVLLMAPGGIIRQEVDFAKADVYALNWVAGAKISNNQTLPMIDLYVDGKKVGESSKVDFPGMADGSSDIFTISAPGKHVIELRAVASGGKMAVNTPAFLDKINLASITAFFGLPGYTAFPNAGDADGEIKQDWYLRNIAAVNMALCYGLESSSYEGGWALGGDFIRSPFMDYANFNAPETAGAEEKMLDIWTTLGGWDFQRHYAQISGKDDLEAARFADFPLVKGVIAHNRRLPLLPGTPGILPERIPQNGILLPGTLTLTNYTFTAGVGPSEISNQPGDKLAVTRLTALDTPDAIEMRWMSWNVIAPATGEYNIAVKTGGGGRFELLLKESQVVTGNSGQPVTAKLKLTRGLHTLKIKCLDGSFNVGSIQITQGTN